MPSSSSSPSPEGDVSTALQVLHFLAPICVAIYFVTAKSVSYCLLQKPSKADTSRQWRFISLAFLCGLIITLIGQAVTYFAESLIHPGRWASQDCMIYVLGSIFVYGASTFGLLDGKDVIWHPYLGSWCVGLVMETAILALKGAHHESNDKFSDGRLALQAIRVFLLLSLSAGVAWTLLSDRQRASSGDEEREPLLANGSTSSNGHAKPPAYGGTSESDQEDIDSDSEEPDRDRELKQQQKKRLEQSGSWLGYLKDFKILIPLVWPAKNRKIQACLGVIGVVILATRFLYVLVPRQLGIIIDELTENAGTGRIPYTAVGVWMLLAWLNSSAGLSIIQQFCELPVQQFSYKIIGITAFRHIMKLSMDFHNDKNSGELIRAIDQGRNVHGLLDFILFHVGPMFVDLIVAFWYVYTLFDIYMTFILMVMGVAYVWVGVKTTSWSIKKRRRFNNAWREESKVQNESIHNWQTVSHFNRAEYECDRYCKTIDEFNASERQYFFTYYTGGAFQSSILILGRLAAMFLAIYRVSQGNARVGSFVTLTAYWGSIESPLAQVSWSVRRVSQMLIDSERLLQLLKTEPSVKDGPDANPLAIPDGRVEFSHVDFSYDPRKTTLKDVTFTAEAGKTIALVGETGSGKTTTLKLLFRYYEIAGGSIKIDGQDIRKVTLDSLRESFGMVPQDPSLFNISIIENIRYARLNATDEEVQDACRAAAIHDKILTFPDGYQSKVGERGVKLSGGELQRVSIARAILRKPKIVLLDEATSMIDAETEALIQEAFKRLTADRTTFIVAHRLSTIQHADLILVVNDGEIIERGTHEELFKLNGKYVKLWSKQLSKERKTLLNNDDDSETEGALIDVTASTDVAKVTSEEVDEDFTNNEGLAQLDGSSDSKPVKPKSQREKGGALRKKMRDIKQTLPWTGKDDDPGVNTIDSVEQPPLQSVSPRPTYDTPAGKLDGTAEEGSHSTSAPTYDYPIRRRFGSVSSQPPSTKSSGNTAAIDRAAAEAMQLRTPTRTKSPSEEEDEDQHLARQRLRDLIKPDSNSSDEEIRHMRQRSDGSYKEVQPKSTPGSRRITPTLRRPSGDLASPRVSPTASSKKQSDGEYVGDIGSRMTKEGKGGKESPDKD